MPASIIRWNSGRRSLVADAPGIYWYAAQDAFGCSYTDTVVVTLAAVSDEEPFIPNVFTPNGDGKNERYLPVNIDDSSFSMDIYNRWGMKVYGSVNSCVTGGRSAPPILSKGVLVMSTMAWTTEVPSGSVLGLTKWVMPKRSRLYIAP